MILVLMACSSNESAPLNSEKATSDTLSSYDFTKSFEGTINGEYGITMILTRVGNSLSGTYSYTSKRIPIKISGNIDSSGNLTINEFNAAGSMTGIFKGQLNGLNITGNWEKPDGSKIMPFLISETKNKEKNPLSNEVICSEKEMPNENDSDPIIIKNCFYKNFKTISKGIPDYKGRYYYDYSVQLKQEDGSYIQVENASIFNDKKQELLSLINAKIKKEFILFSNDPATMDCFDGQSFSTFNFDQIGVEFSEDEIYFHVDFGLGSACMSVDGTLVSFSLEEMGRYIKE